MPAASGGGGVRGHPPRGVKRPPAKTYRGEPTGGLTIRPRVCGGGRWKFFYGVILGARRPRNFDGGVSVSRIRFSLDVGLKVREGRF